MRNKTQIKYMESEEKAKNQVATLADSKTPTPNAERDLHKLQVDPNNASNAGTTLQSMDEKQLPQLLQSQGTSEGEPRDKVPGSMLNVPSMNDVKTGMEIIGGKKSQRSIVPISHMQKQQEQMQQYLQKQQKDSSTKSKKGQVKKMLDMAGMVKGSAEVPMTGESVGANQEINIKHNYEVTEYDEAAMQNMPNAPEDQYTLEHFNSIDGVRNERNHRRRHKQPANPDLVPGQEQENRHAGGSRVSSYSDPNSDQTLGFNAGFSQHSLVLNQQINEVTHTGKNINRDLKDPIIQLSNPGTANLSPNATVSQLPNQLHSPVQYQPLQPYLLETVDGLIPLTSQLDKSGYPIQQQMQNTQQDNQDKNRPVLLKNQQELQKGKQPASPNLISPADTFGSNMHSNQEGEMQVFVPLQGKNLSFKTSGYFTSKTKSGVDSNQNPFKLINNQNTQQSISPRISKPIVMVTKRSDKQSPFMSSGEKSPLKHAGKDRSPREHRKPRKKAKLVDQDSPQGLPMTIGSLQHRDQDPGTKQAPSQNLQTKEGRSSKSKIKKQQLKNAQAEGTTETNQSRDFPGQTDSKPVSVSPGDSPARAKDAEMKHLVVKASPKELLRVLEGDQAKTGDPRSRHRTRIAAQAIEHNVSMLRNVGIGTSYSNEYPDDTVSSSMQSARSRVQVVIQAAHREKHEIIRQVHINQSKKLLTPQRQRLGDRDRTATLLLPPERTPRRGGPQHEKTLKTAMKGALDQASAASSQTMRDAAEDGQHLGGGTLNDGKGLGMGAAQRRHSEDVHLVNTFKYASDRNMFGKKTSAQHIVLPQPVLETVVFKDHREGSGKKPRIPQSLYYTNGYMPRLADLRDALKSNKIFHNRYNPELDDPALREYFKDAIKPTPAENAGELDEHFENQDLLKFIIPAHQAEADKWKKEVDRNKAYIENLGSYQQQQETDARLARSNVEKEQRRQELAKKYEVPKVSFKAHINPWRFKHTTETIAQIMNGTAPRDHPDAKLMHWVTKQRKAERTLPASLFDVDDALRTRIADIIAQENRKMQACDNDFQKFDRLKKEVEINVDNGFSYIEAFKELAKTKRSSTLRKQASQGSELSIQEEKGEEGGGASSLKLSHQQSSVRRSTLLLGPQITVGSSNSLLGQPHYSTIGMDRATPELQQQRQRPDPAFAPASTARPKALKAYKPKRDDPSRPGLITTRNKDLAQHIAKVRRHTVDDVRSTIKEAAEEMERMSMFQAPAELSLGRDDSLFRDTQTRLRNYADASKMKAGLRASKENPELVRTHHSPLRQSKEQPLQYKSIDKGQMSVENDEEAPPEQPAAPHEDGEPQDKTPDVTKDIAQDVRKSLLRDTSVVHIRKGEPILMTDKSEEQLGLQKNVHATSNPNILFAAQGSHQGSAIFLSNPSQNQITAQPSQGQVPSVTSRVPVSAIERSVQGLYRPPLGKSSCNHCIGKVAKEYEKQQAYTPVPSVAGTTKAGTSAAGQTQDLQSQSILQTVGSTDNLGEMTLAELSAHASSIVRGILKECDVTKRVIARQNKQTKAELDRSQRNLQNDIEKWDDILYDIDEAQQAGEVPLWDDVADAKVLEQSTADAVLQDVKWIKKREDVAAMTEMVRWDVKNRKFFKPSPFKFNDDIHDYMLRHNEDYRTMINAPQHKPNVNVATMKR